MCNKETFQYLKYLKLKKIKFIGNLKFSEKKNEKIYIPKKINNFFSKKIYWCAGSTHRGEEIFCIKTHTELKNYYKNFVTIIIPRHINRKFELINVFKENKLNFHCHSWNKKVRDDTEIYLVDTYGESSLFYKICKTVFMGGSLVSHGGQNPLEASRHGCKIIHGPHTNNFKDIYKLLQKLGVSELANTNNKLTRLVKRNIKTNENSTLIIKKIEKMGIKIKELTLKELTQELN